VIHRQAHKSIIRGRRFSPPHIRALDCAHKSIICFFMTLIIDISIHRILLYRGFIDAPRAHRGRGLRFKNSIRIPGFLAGV